MRMRHLLIGIVIAAKAQLDAAWAQSPSDPVRGEYHFLLEVSGVTPDTALPSDVAWRDRPPGATPCIDDPRSVSRNVTYSTLTPLCSKPGAGARDQAAGD